MCAVSHFNSYTKVNKFHGMEDEKNALFHSARILISSESHSIKLKKEPIG